MRRRFAGQILFTILLVSACSASAPQFKTTDISTVEWGKDFVLTTHTGERKRLSDFKGKPVILFFGYTNCPDICGPTLAKLAEVMKKLNATANQAQVIFISVDPAHDTPPQLAKFVTAFDPHFIGMTGTPAEIAVVTQDYKIATQQKAAPTGAASIEHSGGAFIIDRKGKLRLYIKEATPVADIVHDLRLLLKENA
ncbi:MAG TPA: SCO family protein [Acidiferrobacterales bacterium]|nr:SCO family protein [Acidiferrobacterales bacterium]